MSLNITFFIDFNFLVKLLFEFCNALLAETAFILLSSLIIYILSLFFDINIFVLSLKIASIVWSDKNNIVTPL